MIVAEYINHLCIKVNDIKLTHEHVILTYNKNNYVEIREYFEFEHKIEIIGVMRKSTDTGVKLQLILKNQEINISTINNISKNAIFGVDADNGVAYSYILLDIDQTIDKL